jgi:hypothetical protein
MIPEVRPTFKDIGMKLEAIAEARGFKIKSGRSFIANAPLLQDQGEEKKTVYATSRVEIGLKRKMRFLTQ